MGFSGSSTPVGRNLSCLQGCPVPSGHEHPLPGSGQPPRREPARKAVPKQFWRAFRLPIDFGHFDVSFVRDVRPELIGSWFLGSQNC
jgi:hypothetical protein